MWGNRTLLGGSGNIWLFQQSLQQRAVLLSISLKSNSIFQKRVGDNHSRWLSSNSSGSGSSSSSSTSTSAGIGAPKLRPRAAASPAYTSARRAAATAGVAPPSPSPIGFNNSDTGPSKRNSFFRTNSNFSSTNVIPVNSRKVLEELPTTEVFSLLQASLQFPNWKLEKSVRLPSGAAGTTLFKPLLVIAELKTRMASGINENPEVWSEVASDMCRLFSTNRMSHLEEGHRLVMFLSKYPLILEHLSLKDLLSVLEMFGRSGASRSAVGPFVDKLLKKLAEKTDEFSTEDLRNFVFSITGIQDRATPSVREQVLETVLRRTPAICNSVEGWFDLVRILQKFAYITGISNDAALKCMRHLHEPIRAGMAHATREELIEVFQYLGIFGTGGPIKAKENIELLSTLATEIMKHPISSEETLKLSRCLGRLDGIPEDSVLGALCEKIAKELLSSTSNIIEAADVKHITSLIKTFSSLKPLPPYAVDLIDKFSITLFPMLYTASPTDMRVLLTSIGDMEPPLTPAQVDLMVQVADGLRPHIADSNTKYLTFIMRKYSEHTELAENEYVLQFMSEIAKMLLDRRASMELDELAHFLFVSSKLNLFKHDPELLKLFHEMARKNSDFFSLDTAPPKMVSQLIWAITTSNPKRTVKTVKLYKDITEYSLKNFHSFDFIGMSNVLSSIAIFGLYRPTVHKLMEKVTTHFSENVSNATHRSVATVLWSVGQYKIDTSAVVEAQKRILPYFEAHLPSLAHLDVQQTIWSLIRVNNRTEESKNFVKAVLRTYESDPAPMVDTFPYMAAYLLDIPVSRDLLSKLNATINEHIDSFNSHSISQFSTLIHYFDTPKAIVATTTGEEEATTAGEEGVAGGGGDDNAKFIELDPVVKDKLFEKFVEVSTPRLSKSLLQDSVSEVIRLGISKRFTAEHMTPYGYHIDIADPVRKIGVEIQGPVHFTTSKRYSGYTLLKRKSLQQHGWSVVYIPYHKWYSFHTKPQKLDYLKAKLMRAALKQRRSQEKRIAESQEKGVESQS